MFGIPRVRFAFAGLALSLLAASAFAASAPPSDLPRNVILMIPDGCGTASLNLGRLVAGHALALDGILMGACETSSADALITDSAAGVTAYASGIRTRNRVLGLDPEMRPVATILEGAHAKGMSTGLVATSRITHATPAGFAAHVPERNNEDQIAAQELEHRVDVLLGGGRRFFVPGGSGGSRTDSRDLIAEARQHGYTVLEKRGDLRAALRTPVLGLFTPDHMSYEIDRDTLAEPSLAEMARTAIALLSRNPKGFFIMIEGSRIDHAAHQNDPATHARDVLAYDDAVKVALDFARHDRHTLVVSVADHETGGLSLGMSVGDSVVAFDPQALKRATASAERMAREIGNGADPARETARGTGIGDLSRTESTQISDAVARKKDVAETIGWIESHRCGIGWSALSHTAVDVNVHAFGPGAMRFIGIHRNDEIGRMLASLMRVDLDALTTKLRATPESSAVAR
jgi:alkaline phosphatase